MVEVASREIMWNVSSLTNVVAMYSIFAIASVIGLVGLLRHFEIWAAGKNDATRAYHWSNGLRHMFSWGLMQRGTVREPKAAVGHTLIYLGFLVLTFTTTMVMVDHDLGIPIYQGNFYLIVTLLSDLFGLGLLIGLALMAKRRYLDSPDQLHNRPADAIFLITLVLLVIQGFCLEGLRIHVTNDPWATWSPVGLVFAKFFWFLSDSASRTLHFLIWWWHALTVFVFVALFPYTKFLHLFASSINLFFGRSSSPKGQLPFPGDLEKMMETQDDFNIGLQSIGDYSWKHLLDLDACTSCGRCQNVCPAYQTGKPLSPKWLILDTRNHMLALHAQNKFQSALKLVPKFLKAIDQWLQKSVFFPGTGLRADPVTSGYTNSGSYRGSNIAIHDTSLKIGADFNDRIAGDVLSQDVFWSCTTCMACVEACPVGINHVDQIVENRRNMVLMHGEIPSEAQATLRALENRANPYGPAEDRANWLAELDVPILKPGDSVDYLYWVGCVSAFDPRKQKIARALVEIMKRAGLSFGVLGNLEGCSGDPARRLGEENLFQMLAKTNIATLQSVSFQYLVANCPHCFNTIKNEYPQFGNLQNGLQAKIIHHSQLLKRLLEQEKIKLRDQTQQESFTIHDPCYLARYNDEVDAPRASLSKVRSLKIVEMEASGKKGLCCGAGGGHFWMDLKQGERVNVIRTEQAVQTGASNIATACPFCLQMLEDGIKLTGREASHQVKDLAEVIYENLA